MRVTRYELEHIYHLKKELKMWEERLEDLKADITPPVKRITGMPFANTNDINSPTEEKAIRLLECKEAIEKKKTELIKAEQKAEAYILKLDDSQMRIILELRCVGNWKWYEIAGYMGDGYTSESVRKAYSRHMRGLK